MSPSTSAHHSHASSSALTVFTTSASSTSSTTSTSLATMRNSFIASALLFFATFSLCDAASQHAARPGRVWIKLYDSTPLSFDPNNLQLPAHAKVGKSLLQPEQCLSLRAQALSTVSPTDMQGTYNERSNEIARLEQQLLRCYSVEFDESFDLSEFCKISRARCPQIELCMPVYWNYAQYRPNDPKIGQQAYLDSIEMPAAWDITKGDSSVVIAVIDDGARRTHEDLKSSIAPNYAEIPNNGKDDDANGFVDDYLGINMFASAEKTAGDDTFNKTFDHGTCVSSICSATMDNNLGYAGCGGNSRFIPIKASRLVDGLEHIDVGYESILYAALRGAKVINCSWGNDDQGFNPLEQLVIDYAISRNCLIIAAAGNKDDFNSFLSPHYPAAYSGVLGVGECYASGVITDGSTYGAHCHIMAPGANIYTAANSANDAYTDQSAQPFAGTSSAAPIVSGVAALLRAKYPQLSVDQCREHLRISGTGINTQNPTLAAYAPRMVNARRALSMNPMDLPGLRVRSTEYKNKGGQLVSASALHDTIYAFFSLHNYLGSATNVSFKLSAVDPTQSDCIALLDSVQEISALSENADTTLHAFRFVITKPNYQRMFLRLDITAKGRSGADYNDFALVEFYATRDFVTLSNGDAVVSVGDYGWIASNQYTSGERKGNGFATKRFGNLMYRGSMICSCDESMGRSGLGADGSQTNNFDFVRRTEPFPYVLTFGDVSQTGDLRLGVQIENSFTFLPGSILQCDTRIENLSFNTLHRFALGYFLDWDITAAGDSSYVRRFSEAESKNIASAAEMEYRVNRAVVVGAKAMSLDSNMSGQAAGLNYSFISGNFPPQKMYEALHGGTSIQSAGPDDMSMMVGMLCTKDFQPGQVKRVRFLLGAAGTADSLAMFMKAGELSTSVESEARQSLVYPQPASQMLHLQHPRLHLNRVEWYSTAMQLLRHDERSDALDNWSLDTRELSSGVYILRLFGPEGCDQVMVTVLHD